MKASPPFHSPRRRARITARASSTGDGFEKDGCLYVRVVDYKTAARNSIWEIC
jgi:hypothetical protein